MAISLPTRQLLTASLYFGSAVCAITNLALTGGGLTGVNLALSICGIVPWGLAAAQGLYNRYHARKKALSNQVVPFEQADKEESAWQPSTHAFINSALHVTASTFYIASDLYNPTSPVKMSAIRVTGSFFWDFAACTGVWSARKILHEQENHPGTTIKRCGLDAASVNLTCEINYIVSGLFYLTSNLAGPKLIPLKLAANICWILAGTHDVITAYQQLQKRGQIVEHPVDVENPEQHSKNEPAHPAPTP